jgi:hypothetical protein
MTTTRRENFGAQKNSRIARRYAIPATAKEPRKDGPPRSPKLREQVINARYKIAPSTYTLADGVNFTVLLYPSAIVLPPVPTL